MVKEYKSPWPGKADPARIIYCMVGEGCRGRREMAGGGGGEIFNQEI